MAPPLSPTHSTSLPNVVLGRVEPRVFTPPLRDLSPFEASWGWDFIDFCELIGWPLDPWQRWLAVHLGEMLPDGRPRYRKAIVLVARQNGKTLFTRLLILYWMFVERVPMIVATNSDRGEAMRSWRKVVHMAEKTPLLAAALPAKHTAGTTGNEAFWNSYDSHYRFAAPTRRAGRGDTVHRALLDELREHKTRDTWDAIVPAQNAVRDALLVCISNEGDSASVVLHEEYDAAEAFIDTGEGDARTFLASWSAPSGTAPDDVDALAQANPGLGHRIDIETLLGEAKTRMSAGGETLQRFRIEYLCQRVDALNTAIRIEDWKDCGVHRDQALSLAEHRRQVVLCFDVTMNNSHATLVAAAMVDGVTHLDVVAAWDGMESRKNLRAELAGYVAKIRPRKVVWFPGGPAAAVADQWPGKRIKYPGAGGRPGGSVKMEAIRAEDVVRACMGLEEQAAARHIQHTHDPLMDAQVKQAVQLKQGDGWRFERRGKLPIDAVYAAAGAAHEARTLPVIAPLVAIPSRR
jgi:phage terminase large subunit-like protein